jgi:hypothetical protein
MLTHLAIIYSTVDVMGRPMTTAVLLKPLEHQFATVKQHVSLAPRTWILSVVLMDIRMTMNALLKTMDRRLYLRVRVYLEQATAHGVRMTLATPVDGPHVVWIIQRLVLLVSLRAK